MNENQYLVLIKNEDATSEIYSCKETTSSFVVTYKKSGKTYRYSKANVEILTNPAEIDMEEYDFKISGEKQFDIIKVLKFKSKYKLFFIGRKSIIVDKEKLSITEKSKSIKTLQSTNKWEYLRQISNIVSLKTEEENYILTQEFDKIDEQNTKTALYKYLHSSEDINKYTQNKYPYIFPFR